MKIDLFLLVVVLILNILFYFSYSRIAKIFNLYDIPDFSRKIHKEKIAAVGGILFYLFYIMYFLGNFQNDDNLFSFRESISILIIISIFFFIGLIDDKFTLGSNTKLLLMILFSLCLVMFNEEFSIKKLNFSFTEKQITLGEFSILFTVICILCFVNACNMFDGIDLQFGTYLIFLSLIFIYKGFMINFNTGIIICSIFFLINNFRKKIFIGNNGTLFLSILYSIFFIFSYSKNNLFFVDEIFLCMAIPGYDLIRVSLLRLTKGKHMFSPDNQHIHHFLINKIGTIKTNILIQFSIFAPIIVYYLTKDFFISFIISIFSYVGLIFFAKKKTKFQ